MCRNKLLLVFQSMLLFLGSAPVVAVVPQWAREKKPDYGGYAFAAVLVGAGMYGGYRLYKNLKINKKNIA